MWNGFNKTFMRNVPIKDIVNIDVCIKCQTWHQMSYQSQKSSKSSLQIIISSKSAKTDVNMSGQIGHIYTLEEIHTYHPFVFKQLR